MEANKLVLERVSKGSFTDSSYVIDTMVVRLTPAGLDSWFEAERSFNYAKINSYTEMRKENEKFPIRIWEERILEELGINLKHIDGYSISRNVSEIFTIVIFRKNN